MRPIRRRTRETLRHERAVVRQQITASVSDPSQLTPDQLATNKRRAEAIRRKALKAGGGALLLMLLLTASGCRTKAVTPGDDQAPAISALSPGRHKITKAIRGTWKATNATKGCHWTMGAQHGEWALNNREPWVLIGTGNLGETFWANDACGTWTS